jgi:hypothetical protein
VVDLDPAFGEQLLDIAVGQREAQVPPHRQHDDVWWEAETGEGGPSDRREATAVRSHRDGLPAQA